MKKKSKLKELKEVRSAHRIMTLWKKVNKFSKNDKKFFWRIYLSITFSTGYQRVKAKKSEERAQRIKIQSQQF